MSERVPPSTKRPDLPYSRARHNADVINPGSIPGQTPPWARGIGQGEGISFVQFAFSVSANTIEQIAPQKLDRVYLLIQNNSGTPIYLGIGTEIDSSNGVLIPAGGFYEPYTAPNNSIFVMATSDANGVILQG